MAIRVPSPFYNAGANPVHRHPWLFLRLPPGARKVAASASVGHAQITRRAMWMALNLHALPDVISKKRRVGMLCHRGPLQLIPLIQRAPERQPRAVGTATVVVLYRRCRCPFTSPHAPRLPPPSRSGDGGIKSHTSA